MNRRQADALAINESIEIFSPPPFVLTKPIEEELDPSYVERIFNPEPDFRYCGSPFCHACCSDPDGSQSFSCIEDNQEEHAAYIVRMGEWSARRLTVRGAMTLSELMQFIRD